MDEPRDHVDTLALFAAARPLDSSALERLTLAERLLLVLPVGAGALLGLGPLLAPGSLAGAVGYAGDDPYILRLAGSASLGYAVAVALAIRGERWSAGRLPVVAILASSLASLYACAFEIASGRAGALVSLGALTSLGFVALAGGLLARHRDAEAGPSDMGGWLIRFLALGMVAAMASALLALLLPVETGRFFGYRATDVFLYRESGAATLGYAVMGAFELRSRRWAEIEHATVMALVFTGASLLASAHTLLAGETGWLAYIVGPVSVAVTALCTIALVRRGH